MATVDPAYAHSPQPPLQNQTVLNADGTTNPAFVAPPPPGMGMLSTQVPSATGATLPVGAPVPTSADAPKTFSDFLFDKFSLVYERVTRGRRDLKHVKDVFDQRAADERAGAKQIGLHGSAVGDVVDSSSLQPVWLCVKEQAITTAKQRESFAACCTELSAVLGKNITDIKVAKTRLHDNYNRVVADVQKKQALHDRARQIYADSVRAAERAIIERDNGLKQMVQPKRQVQLDQAAQLAVRTVDGRQIEYGAAVTALAGSQRAYDLGIADIMKQLEQVERERLRILHDVLNRYTAQHDALKRAVEAQTEALYRVLSTVNTAEDIQKFILSNTSHPRIRPHIENVPIINPLIENYRKNPNGPPQMQQQPGGLTYGVPPLQPTSIGIQQQPTQQQSQFQSQPFQQPYQQVPPQQFQQPMIQQQVQQPQPQFPSAMQPQQSLNKIVPPPPPTNGFVPPAATAIATAQFDFDAVEADDLPFKAGQTIKLIKFDAADDWWTGELDGRQGIFPKTYVKKTDAPIVQQPSQSHAQVPITQQPTADYQSQQNQYPAPQYQNPPVTNAFQQQQQLPSDQHSPYPQYQNVPAPQYQQQFPPQQQQPQAQTNAPGFAQNYNPNAVIAPPGTQTLVTVLAPTRDEPRLSTSAPATNINTAQDYGHSAPPHYNEQPPASLPMSAVAPPPAAAEVVATPPTSRDADAPVAANGISEGAGTRGKCTALFDFEGQDGDELSFKRGQILVITDDYEGWFLGHIEGQSKVGLFPSNHVQVNS